VLLEHQSELLRVLIEAWPQQSVGWLHGTFQMEAIRSAAAPAGADGISLFLQLLTHRPPLQHELIAREFARVCRRKGGIDALRKFVPSM
jgi:hypothetical protein